MNLISQHIFMLPFNFYSTGSNRYPKCDWDYLVGHIITKLAPIWRESIFSPHSGGFSYGEFQYFHPHVREQYFDLAPGQAAVRFFKLALPNHDLAIYRIIRGENITVLELVVKSISLRLCETGVGLLSLELHNYKHPTFEEVLLINNLGRCVFTPYMAADKVDNAITNGNAPARIEIELGYLEAKGEFNDKYFKKPGLGVAAHITDLLASAGLGLEGAPDSAGLPFRFRPTADDRMFVVCWFGSQEWSNHMQIRRDDGGYQYQNDSDWYRLVFVDSCEPLCQHEGMRQELIAQSTYCRWADYGTLYGITRYSLICLANRNDTSLTYLREYMRGVYAQMMAMLLIQRASLLRFSGRVAEASREARDNASAEKANISEIAGQAERLQLDYLNFVNRLWFTEVSPQEQAIEMYSQAFNLAGLDKSMEELRTEIGELHAFIRMNHEKNEGEALKGITLLGVLFLPLSLLAAIFSMNLDWFEKIVPKEHWFSTVFKVLVFAAMSSVLYSLVRCWLHGLGPGMAFVANELHIKKIVARLRDKCRKDQDFSGKS